MKRILKGFGLLVLFVGVMMAGDKKKLQVGDQAPGFQLVDDSGQLRSLDEFKGKKIVLYFYPKDDTPGCTKEACSFRDNAATYADHDIVVIGISYDSPESHKKFKEKYQLPFILLSDSKKKVAKLYGAYGGLMRMLVPKRITFLIDESGKIVHIFKKVDVVSHASDVFKQFGLAE